MVVSKPKRPRTRTQAALGAKNIIQQLLHNPNTPQSARTWESKPKRQCRRAPKPTMYKHTNQALKRAREEAGTTLETDLPQSPAKRLNRELADTPAAPEVTQTEPQPTDAKKADQGETNPSRQKVTEPRTLKLNQPKESHTAKKNKTGKVKTKHSAQPLKGQLSITKFTTPRPSMSNKGTPGVRISPNLSNFSSNQSLNVSKIGVERETRGGSKLTNTRGKSSNPNNTLGQGQDEQPTGDIGPKT